MYTCKCQCKTALAAHTCEYFMHIGVAHAQLPFLQGLQQLQEALHEGDLYWAFDELVLFGHTFLATLAPTRLES